MDDSLSMLVFKYCLPVLLGYTLYVGIAGSLNPFHRPENRLDRPNWFFGCWTGLLTASSMAMLLHAAYDLPIEMLPKLLLPTGFLAASVMVSGIVLYTAYLRVVSIENEEVLDFGYIPVEDETTPALPAPEGHVSITGYIHDAADSESDTPEAVLDIVSRQFWPDFDDEETERLAAVGDEDIDLSVFGGKDACHDISVNTSSGPSVDAEDDTTHDEALASIGVLESQCRELRAELDTLGVSLGNERSLREQTEMHLRVTRKALSVLASETRDHESARADTLIEFEQQLESRIREVASANSNAEKERKQRIAAEETIVDLKQQLAQASRKLRKGTEARARALATANKSMTLARQSVQVRAQLEEELKELKATLADRQTTISSLISALDKEKQRAHEQGESTGRAADTARKADAREAQSG
ncbi:MAG: hypothetical protein CSB44_04855 [Gammaproteobacteria bacterium]|nr:MAG: hypothetical protein CSB44_04855 [Gammaproteobacteria bacterium]